MCACVRVTSLVRLVDLAVEQDGLEEPEHGGEEAHHLGLLDDRRRGVAQPGHGGEARDEISLAENVDPANTARVKYLLAITLVRGTGALATCTTGAARRSLSSRAPPV
jgi:hypothetical protein